MLKFALILVLAYICQACISPPTADPTAPAPSPPSQASPPNLNVAIAARCGHSQYYGTVNENPGGGIVGGTLVTDRNKYPWIVRIRILNINGGYTNCAGSIISKEWVLTSAKCLAYMNTSSSATVYFGEHDQTNNAESHEFYNKSMSFILHPAYNPSTMSYNIALLKLAINVSFTSRWNVQKICLPTSCDDGCAVSSTVWAAGWGLITENSAAFPNVLHHAWMQVISFDSCKTAYFLKYLLPDNVMCAGFPSGGVGLCVGDEGGPLMTTENGYYKICGVASFAEGCGRSGYPYVFTKVCSVLPWIYQVTGITEGAITGSS